MKYALLDRGDRLSRTLSERFRAEAKARGLIYDERDPRVVVSIGGDGTMLQAFHRYKNQLGSVAFLGIHTGHLGFYADWQKDELEGLLDMMSSGQPTHIQYPLLNVVIEKNEGESEYLVLNEFTLKSAEGTLVSAIHINDEPFEMFRGDGIVISTPTGSTGYNKSLGGAVIHPSLEALQIAEIASINNRVYRTLGSSVILPKHHHCDIIPPDPEEELYIGVDHMLMPMKGVRSIMCKVAEDKVTFARYRPFPFWNRVREAFIGSL
ncbi:NAD kinase [Paenibacillaceae bacterium WGS1546]|uniref:NAD kinase n=1 Tax=Cohnella sp. WGS1546 TaxID=3366810 RepID=UPI00372D59D8